MRATVCWIAIVGLTIGICAGCGSTVTTPAPTAGSGGKSPPYGQPPIDSAAPGTNGAADSATADKPNVATTDSGSVEAAKPADTKQPAESTGNEDKKESGDAKPDESKP